MLRIYSKALCLVFLALALAANVCAGEGDTLITDPALLTRLGFPRDARNVYLAKGAVLDQKSSPAAPKEFGTTEFGWTTVLGSQHIPLASPANYSVTPEMGIHKTSVGTDFYVGQLQMPSGTLLQQVTWFGRDDVPVGNAELGGTVIRVCQSGIPAAPPVVTILGSGLGGDAEVVFTVIVPGGEVVRNLNCAYVAQTSFDGVFGPALILRKIRAGWQRQVSPAPATATFPNDVPTTHPFFQFIEALADAGITAGCAPQAFCPDAPITRGQMAVFVAAALGL